MAMNAGIRNIKMSLFKPFSVSVGRCMSKLARQNHIKNIAGEVEQAEADERRQVEALASCWMPDPRTGIYYPKGQEWVMDGVPNDAASFDCTFWLRSIDGVDDHYTPEKIDLVHH